jgi:hypothetical protein
MALFESGQRATWPGDIRGARYRQESERPPVRERVRKVRGQEEGGGGEVVDHA